VKDRLYGKAFESFEAEGKDLLSRWGKRLQQRSCDSSLLFDIASTGFSAK